MIPSKSSLRKLLALAERAVVRAGRDLRGPARKEAQLARDTRRDVKLKADYRSEGIVTRILRKGSPFALLGEEGGWSGPRKDGDPCWIVDPLDGSLNYLRGIPLCCVSVGLWLGERPLLGVVHDFNRGETFSGIVGAGARLNGRPIRAAKPAPKSKSVLCTGFPVGTSFSRSALKDFIESVRDYKKVRLLGSAALSLAYVACGRADAYAERDIKLWDVAAGIPLALASGARVRFRPSKKTLHYTVTCGVRH